MPLERQSMETRRVGCNLIATRNRIQNLNGIGNELSRYSRLSYRVRDLLGHRIPVGSASVAVA
jgi:hypothetical protein